MTLAERFFKEGYDEGFKIGLKEGIKEFQMLKFAERMLLENEDEAKIARICQLDLSEIKKLKEELAAE